MIHAETFRRQDGRFAWHAKSGNGEIIATDGGQGYENEGDAQKMADRLVTDGQVALLVLRAMIRQGSVDPVSIPRGASELLHRLQREEWGE